MKYKSKSMYKNSTFLTVHLEDVSLVDLLVTLSIARVVAHVGSGNLRDIQGPVISKVLYESEMK